MHAGWRLRDEQAVAVVAAAVVVVVVAAAVVVAAVVAAARPAAEVAELSAASPKMSAKPFVRLAHSVFCNCYRLAQPSSKRLGLAKGVHVR